MTDRQKRIIFGLAIGAFISLIVHFGTYGEGSALSDILDRYEYQSYDARMRAKTNGVEEASIESVVVIDIEQNSIANLGNYHEWPHAYHGQLIDVVSSGEPKALIFDIIFDQKDDGTYKLVESLSWNQTNSLPDVKNAADQFLVSHDPGRFVWSTSKSQTTHHALVFEGEDTLNFLYAMDEIPDGYDASKHIINITQEVADRLPEAARLGNTYTDLLSHSSGAGSANFPQDKDGITRRAPTAIHFKGSGDVFLSLTMSAVKEILGISVDGFDYDFGAGLLRLIDTSGIVVREIPIDDQGRMFVNYYGPYKTFYYIPYMYCFDPEMLDPTYWTGKVALVGSSLPGLMDLRNTPVQETFAGVEIHANVIHSILNNQFISMKKSSAKLLAMMLMAIVVGALSGFPGKPLWGFAVLSGCIAVWVVFTYSQFLNELVVWDIVRPALAMALTQLSVFSYTFLILDKDKRFLRQTFGTYISPKLIDKMIAEKTEPKLGGQEGMHTAFFSDIEGFTKISEEMKPVDLVQLLNEYLTDMTAILLENQGTLDKYIGDAIVAFYGAPIPVKDHEYMACITALAMQKQQNRLRNRWKKEGERWPDIVHLMNTRIGLHTGPMVTGNMGSEQRMNYTMMGDTVNLASRLEASAKQYGVYTQISEDTYTAVKERVVARELDHVRVVGKSLPVKTYELIALSGEEPETYKTLIPEFQEALKTYRDNKFKKAKTMFRNLEKIEETYPGRKKNPSQVYVERCSYLISSPPEEGWGGVWTLTEKK
tara:strand:- start:13632 stop:15929 length:2298 start_codon:yes stop_codon:yes gene_type:complete